MNGLEVDPFREISIGGNRYAMLFVDVSRGTNLSVTSSGRAMPWRGYGIPSAMKLNHKAFRSASYARMWMENSISSSRSFSASVEYSKKTPSHTIQYNGVA